MDSAFLTILNMSVTASFVIVAVCLARFLLRRAPKGYSYVLWLVVLFNLLCPLKIESAFSLIPFKTDLVTVDQIVPEYKVDAQKNRETKKVNVRAINPDETVDGGTANDEIDDEKLNIQGERKNVILMIPSEQMAAPAETSLNPDSDSLTDFNEKTDSNGMTDFNDVSDLNDAADLSAMLGEGVLELLSWIWMVGIVLMLICAAVTYTALKRKLRFATRVEANVYETDQIRSPFVLGFLNPKIYLPTNLSENDLAYILLHERTHISRRDHLIKFTAYFTLVLHWFNPFVWLTYELLSKDMEMSCDEVVIKKMSSESDNIKVVYANALLCLATGKRLIGLSPLAFGEGNVKERIINVLNYRKPSRWIVVTAVLLVIVVSIGFAGHKVEQKDQEADSGAERIVDFVSNDTTHSVTEIAMDSESVSKTDPITVSAPAFEPDFVFQTEFTVKPEPNNYMFTMSSYPGIYLFTAGQISGQAIIQYECSSGHFGTLKDSVITILGKLTEHEFGGSPAVFWAPDENTKEGDSVLVRLINENSSELTAINFDVNIDGDLLDCYSLIRSVKIESMGNIQSTLPTNLSDELNQFLSSVDQISSGVEEDYFMIQKSVDSGQQLWRLNPEEVALRFVTQTLSFQGEAVLDGSFEKESARVTFIKQNGSVINVDLYQPATKGKGGIWAIDCWYNEKNRCFQVRNWRKLPPMFHNDENVPQKVREAVRATIVKEWTDTFGKYYQVLGFEANGVSYLEIGNVAEVKFLMSLVTQNFYKNPDTVEYIREAKENNLVSYQQLHEEYNLPKIGNVDLKATMLLTPSGDVELGSIQIFSNVSPHGEEYFPVKADDFIF